MSSYESSKTRMTVEGTECSTIQWQHGRMVTVEVQQGCLLSLIFLERIMHEALKYHEGSACIAGRLITNAHFADGIVVNAEDVEADGLVNRCDTTTKSIKCRLVLARRK